MSNKEEQVRYKKLNTPLVTDMLNMFQFGYASPEIRGKFDEISVNNVDKKIAPIFSAFTAFVLTTAFTMRMPGEEKVVLTSDFSKDQMLEKIQSTLDSIEVFYKDEDLRSDLMNSLRTYILNGKFNCKPGGEA
jgi:hypothetical protein